MNENEQEVINSTNDTEETVNDIEINLEEEIEEVEDTDALKKQIETLKAQKDHWKTKATKVVEAPKVESKTDTLSTKDLYLLMENKVSADDIADVEEYAKLKKISIGEALKSNVVKSILADKEEQRNVANATNVGNTKRGSSKVSDDVLYAKAMKGEMPESPEDIARLTRIRRGIK